MVRFGAQNHHVFDIKVSKLSKTQCLLQNGLRPQFKDSFSIEWRLMAGLTPPILWRKWQGGNDFADFWDFVNEYVSGINIQFTEKWNTEAPWNMEYSGFTWIRYVYTHMVYIQNTHTHTRE